MNKYYRVYADVDLDIIASNVSNLMSLTKEGTKAMAVVKADGYGHGDVAVAKAVENQVHMYAVATIDEAVNLRENGIDKPILILGFVNVDEYEILVKNNVTATIFDYETALELNQVAESLNMKATCHIKVDTGMRRIGLEPDESGLNIIDNIVKLKNLSVEGIFTHFATSDEADKSRANRQLQVFEGFLALLDKRGIDIKLHHCANSAAVIDMGVTHMDMVRLGIAMYGMYPSEEVNKRAVMLRPALKLMSHVVYVKEVGANEAVSYGATFVTDRPTRLATVSVGYGDGYPRALSSKGYVLINGRRAPIVGRVCMDQMMVDVTDIPDVIRGSRVTLIGRDGDEVITVEEIAKLAGTFNYEFVCDLNKRIPRNYYRGEKLLGSHDYFHEKWIDMYR